MSVRNRAGITYGCTSGRSTGITCIEQSCGDEPETNRSIALQHIKAYSPRKLVAPTTNRTRRHCKLKIEVRKLKIGEETTSRLPELTRRPKTPHSHLRKSFLKRYRRCVEIRTDYGDS